MAGPPCTRAELVNLDYDGEGLAHVEDGHLVAKSHGRQSSQEGGRRPVGEEVEGVAEQDGLEVGDRLHSRDVAHDLRLLHDQPSVGDREAVQEVHQDDDDEEDEGDEEGESQPGEF